MTLNENRLRRIIREEVRKVILESSESQELLRGMLTRLKVWAFSELPSLLNYNKVKPAIESVTTAVGGESPEALRLVNSWEELINVAGRAFNNKGKNREPQWIIDHDLRNARKYFLNSLEAISKRWLKEITGTSAVAPFRTPYAFQGSSEQNRAKRYATAAKSTYSRV
jgi:hypothetical protein